jgi:NAD(P)-dependent dehydrogenase (short-subunit alcohol dehydrogenase family)
MRLLEGDTALITGASSGIGRGVAKALAGEGARLVLSDIAEQPGQALARELNAKFVAADLADPAAPHKLFEAAEKAVGDISILVHSASPKRYGQAAAAQMKAHRIKGRMLFVTSPHAQTPRNLPHYSATKAGQTMLVKELARALGADGIRVNAIAPGAVPGGGFDADTATLSKMIPLGRTGTPEDIADMAVALLSDRFSRYVTGTTIVVDGGLSLYNWIPVRS